MKPSLVGTAFALVLIPLASACSSGGSEGACSQTGSALSVCAGSSIVHGVDVSIYQNTVDWAKVKSAGKDFGIARISDGTAYPDSQFTNNWKGMKSAGLVRGAYQFFRASVSPTAQADLVASMLHSAGGFESTDLPIVMDIETADGQSSSTVQANMKAWLAAVEQKTGKKPIIYTAEFMSSVIGGGFGAYTLWVANYGATCPAMPSGWSKWKFWQYADNGSVSGIGGAVDLDEFNGTLAELEAFAGDVPDAGSTSDAGTKNEAGAEDASAGEDAGVAEDAGLAPPTGNGGAMGGAGNGNPTPPSATPGPCGP